MKLGLSAILLGLCAIASANAAPQKRDPNVVLWHILGDVEWVFESENDPMDELAGKYVVKFGDSVRKLEGSTIKLRGFMTPLDNSELQSQFLLTRLPLAGCNFCQEGGTDVMVEVRAKEPVAFSYGAVMVKGRLELLPEDPAGMFYRVHDATPIEKPDPKVLEPPEHH